ncbi:hypothetical protein ACFRMQ_09520 [Kitasatospora sp. NPDC056783]|uniref:hypothetical protein n=1 Tax=Kitasatospora sp. NPDC056783 TaxID=3345943 RepID=UPI0036C30D5C
MDGHAYDLSIILPPEDVRAVVAYVTGQDPGPPDAVSIARAGEEITRAAEGAVTALLRRCIDYRPLAAVVTVQRQEVDPNARIPLTGPADPA